MFFERCYPESFNFNPHKSPETITRSGAKLNLKILFPTFG
jgi:hypothetical protein